MRGSTLRVGKGRPLNPWRFRRSLVQARSRYDHSFSRAEWSEGRRDRAKRDLFGSLAWCPKQRFLVDIRRQNMKNGTGCCFLQTLCLRLFSRRVVAMLTVIIAKGLLYRAEGDGGRTRSGACFGSFAAISMCKWVKIKFEIRS